MHIKELRIFRRKSTLNSSPEIIRGETYQGPKAEIWQLGILLYTIIFGENPFHSRQEILNYRSILNFPKAIDKDCADLLHSMICVNTKKRITLEKVLKK